MLQVVRYACADWLITPVASAAGEAPPSNIRDQSFNLILSGVAMIAFDHEPGPWPWRKNTLHILPDLDAPLGHAVSRYSIPTPPGEPGLGFGWHFQVDQMVSFAGLASIENAADHAMGFASDAWRAHPFETRTDAVSSASLPRLFNGIDVDLAIWDGPGILHRVNYHITLVGKIAFSAILIT